MKTAEEIIKPALLEWDNIDEQMEGIKFITRGKCLEAMEEYASQRDTVSDPKEEGKGAEEIKDIIDYILKWDTMHNSHLANANYLAVIQRDLKKATGKK